MIKTILKPLRRIFGIEQYNKLYNQYNQLMEEYSKATIKISEQDDSIVILRHKLDDALDGNVSLSCTLKHKDEEIETLEAKITMQSESLRKAAERIVELEKEIEQLKILNNSCEVAIHHLESFVKTKPYKVWVTRDKYKLRHPDVEIWTTKPKYDTVQDIYYESAFLSIPENTFRRHCGFVPYKGQMLEGSIWLEVKR